MGEEAIYTVTLVEEVWRGRKSLPRLCRRRPPKMVRLRGTWTTPSRSQMLYGSPRTGLLPLRKGRKAAGLRKYRQTPQLALCGLASASGRLVAVLGRRKGHEVP
ncbi:MAG: hypothetical protein ACKPKO_59005, partial [Candidatus Fonsibacter sp.]